MSRLGKIPVTIPGSVTVTHADGVLTIQGPKGTLSRAIRPDVAVTIDGATLTLEPQKTADAPAL